jgi:hypothetical protein
VNDYKWKVVRTCKVPFLTPCGALPLADTLDGLAVRTTAFERSRKAEMKTVAPTYQQIVERIKRLPPHLQQAALEAVESLRQEEENFISAGPPGARATSPAAVSPWPGYLEYLKTAPIEVLRGIAVEGRYWLLSWEERYLIRSRLGWTTGDLVAEREKKRGYPTSTNG